MERKLLVFAVVLLLLFSENVFSQINGKPRSSDSLSNQMLKNSYDIHTITTTIPNIDSLIEFERVLNLDGKNRPEFYGYTYQVNHNLYTTGTWDTLVNGDRIWRLRIKCPLAYSINLLFENFILSENSDLFYYNVSNDFILGPFNRRINRQHRKYATHLIKGNDIIIELFEPKSEMGQNNFNIKRIVYGYKDVFPAFNTTSNHIKNYEQLQSSGWCNIDVNCPEGDDWCKEKFSVALVLLPTNDVYYAQCSGSLLNNTRNDYIPYFLTAFHCLDNYAPRGSLSQTEIDNVDEWSFRFGYMRDGCNNGRVIQFYDYSGADFVSGWSTSDFALIQLQTQPQSGEQEYFDDVYFNGWDRTGSIPNTVTGIHHPSGDLMKISHDYEPPVITGYPIANTLCNQEYQYNFVWRVVWNLGTTEHVSSGSPLFDDNKRVIGQLFNGCASCSYQNQRDYYGRLSISWEGGGTPETRLKDWLDPDDTGAEVLDGAKLPNYWWGKEVVYNEYVHRKAITNLTIGSSATNPFQTNAGSVTNLQAGKEIVMKPCTKILAGSTFRAYIEETVCTDIIATSDKLIDYGGDICEEILSRISVVDIVEQSLTKNDIKLIIKPNPLFDNAKIQIRILPNTMFNLALYDLLGNKIIEFANNEVANTSQKEYILNSTNIPSGIYTIILQSDNDVISERIAIIK